MVAADAEEPPPILSNEDIDLTWDPVAFRGAEYYEYGAGRTRLVREVHPLSIYSCRDPGSSMTDLVLGDNMDAGPPNQDCPDESQVTHERILVDDEGEGDELEDEIQSRKANTLALSFACPFRKRNPLRFNVQDYPGCGLHPFATLSMVK